MIVIIANPAAGNRPRKKIEAALARARAVFRESDQTEIVWSDSQDSAIRLAGQAVSHGAGLVVAAGGDGTVRQMAEVLSGTPTALSFLPMGTENVLAKFSGLSFDPEKCARQILLRPVRKVDVGEIRCRSNRKIFMLFAGIGFDAHVVRQTPPHMKRSMGGFGLVATAAAEAWKRRNGFSHFNVVGDGIDLKTRSWQMLIGNIPIYGWRLPIFPKAQISDGKLEGRFFPAAPLFGRLAQIIEVSRGKRGKNGSTFQFQKITVEADPEAGIQADGDWIGSTPCQIEVVPSSLSVRF